MSPVDLCKRTSGMVPGALLLHCHSMKSAIVGEKWWEDTRPVVLVRLLLLQRIVFHSQNSVHLLPNLK